MLICFVQAASDWKITLDVTAPVPFLTQTDVTFILVSMKAINCGGVFHIYIFKCVSLNHSSHGNSFSSWLEQMFGQTPLYVTGKGPQRATVTLHQPSSGWVRWRSVWGDSWRGRGDISDMRRVGGSCWVGGRRWIKRGRVCTLVSPPPPPLNPTPPKSSGILHEWV